MSEPSVVSPRQVIVMGVTGCGKTTIASHIAARMGWTFADADDYHSLENKERMAAGVALTDADREPWLHSLGDLLQAWSREGLGGVLACSALKRSYRDRLRRGVPDAVFVYLRLSQADVEERLKGRKGHFAGSSLVPSQFAALEEPGDDEPVIVLDATRSIEELTDKAVEALSAEPARKGVPGAEPVR